MIKNQVWIASASINQYLNENELDNILKIFSVNKYVNHFYLFYTIDPNIYFSYDSSIINSTSFKSFIKLIFFKFQKIIAIDTTLY